MRVQRREPGGLPRYVLESYARKHKPCLLAAWHRPLRFFCFLAIIPDFPPFRKGAIRHVFLVGGGVLDAPCRRIETAMRAVGDAGPYGCKGWRNTF